MNWISEKFKRIKPKFKKIVRFVEDRFAGNWVNCAKCKKILYKSELEENFHVCINCNFHLRISPQQRFKILFDEGKYETIESLLVPDDPLNFYDSKSYKKRLADARQKTGKHDCVELGVGKMNGMDVVIGSMEFEFIGGTLGRQAGESFIYGAEYAYQNNIPYIFHACSGGARLQENMFALVNLPRTIIAVNSLKEKKIPFISVCTSPTGGGVTASFGMLGDVNIGEKGADILFAGRKVIEGTTREPLPESFQKAEYLLEKGMLDLVLQRKDMKKTISTLLYQLTNKNKTFQSENQLVNEQQQSPLGTIRSIDPITKTSS
jgi:acetyl-CoA carboxylase carboxyl transferase subunit beta